MIIALVTKKEREVRDLLLQAFDGAIPVAEGDTVIGQCWLMERGPQLIVLPAGFQAQASEWALRDRHVLIPEMPDVNEDFAEDNVLVVSDRPGAYPCCTLVGSDPQELADLIERAIQ